MRMHRSAPRYWFADQLQRGGKRDDDFQRLIKTVEFLQLLLETLDQIAEQSPMITAELLHFSGDKKERLLNSLDKLLTD